jgi:hypothetical protein
MKRCSTCNRTYTDPSLSFCIDDGTPLTVVAEDESTVVSLHTTEDATNNDRNEVAYRPPAPYVPAGTQVRSRRAWPWVLGILGAFILGIIAISIAAVILAPRLLKSRQNEQARQTSSNEANNSNTSEPANSNTDANVNIDVPPPADHEQVLAQLTDLENDWTVANINDNKKELDRILADDYVSQAPDGSGPISKAEYIRTNQRDVRVEKWDFDDLKLMLVGDRATLTGKITYEIQEGKAVYDFTDKFVWRDGRWQATGSEIKRRE